MKYVIIGASQGIGKEIIRNILNNKNNKLYNILTYVLDY